jgi:hypothetical protein
LTPEKETWNFVLYIERSFVFRLWTSCPEVTLDPLLPLIYLDPKNIVHQTLPSLIIRLWPKSPISTSCFSLDWDGFAVLGCAIGSQPSLNTLVIISLVHDMHASARGIFGGYLLRTASTNPKIVGINSYSSFLKICNLCHSICNSRHIIFTLHSSLRDVGFPYLRSAHFLGRSS